MTDCEIYLISERMAERINNIESSPEMTIKELLNENFSIYGYEMHGSHIEIKDIEKKIDEYKIELLLSGEYDKNDAILNLHAYHR